MSDELFEAPSLEYLGAHLPHYEFVDFIAQGGMGAVYKARQVSLDRVVAIKVLPHELGENEEFRDSFAKEAKAMAKLNHPNLIGVFDSGDLDGMPYIVMEYIEGDSLHDFCWGQKLETQRAVEIVLGICRGLEDAHNHGIIHRDIKPANILLTDKEEPKIGDFGLAHPSDSEELGLIMGTPGYTSPETFDDPEQAGVLADQYSVGVILHQLATGLDPQGMEGPPTEPTGNLKLDAIWRKATQPNPADRYPSISEMAEALEALKKKPAAAPAPVGRALNVGPPRVGMGPPGTAPQLRLKSAKSSNTFVKLVILALLAAAAWYGYKYYQDSQNPFDGELPNDENSGLPGFGDNSPAGNRPKPNGKPSKPGSDRTNAPKGRDDGKNGGLTRQERREQKKKDRLNNPRNFTPNIPEVGDSTPTELAPGDPELRKKAVDLILDARSKRDALLEKNTAEFRRLCEYEAARAARDDSRMYEKLRKQAESGWVPEPDDLPKVSEAVARAHRNAHNGQVSIESKHLTELTRIRDYYVPTLKKAAKATSDEDKKKRLLAQARQASDVAKWVQILAPEPAR